MAGNLSPVRMVIQQTGISETPSYRVVVYGDELKPKHSDFSNAQILVEALRTAIPSFDLAQLTLNPLGKGRGSIVFNDEFQLSDTQLSGLGLD